jgi:hypothetical protein
MIEQGCFPCPKNPDKTVTGNFFSNSIINILSLVSTKKAITTTYIRRDKFNEWQEKAVETILDS